LDGKVIIFDIDGTLANIEHRKHHIKTKPKEWNQFVEKIPNDSMYDDIVELLSLFHRNFYTIILVTGRGEEHQEATLQWLIKHQLEARITKVYMRRRNDFRPDYIVKREILETMRAEGYDPWMVFEDRTQVVNMWRENGIRCMQVCAGDY